MLAYSYHSFMLPLIWDHGNKGDPSFAKLCRVFDDNSYWNNADPDPETGFSPEDDPLDFYSEYQYFYPQARGALYGYGGKVVRSFVMAEQSVRNKAKYIIKKGDTTYNLLLNAIRVKIYSSGVMLFMLECENHEHCDLASVKAINDYGRRICLPFIKPFGSACADKLEIVIDDLGVFETDFDAFRQRMLDASADKDSRRRAINLNYMAGYIRRLLGFGSEYEFVSSETRNKKHIFIRPALDDRMFVACAVTDRERTGAFLSVPGNDTEKIEREYAFMRDETLQKSLYELIFLDREDECSCMNEKMRKELLDAHVYKRWLDSGSIYAIAAQSLVMLTDGGASFLVDNFLTEYVKMACLCLAQRASLILFQKQIAAISTRMNDGKKRTGVRSVSSLMNVQERFSTFESQLCFDEISSQEQAIELYDMFRSSFKIEGELENVKSQLEGLNHTADTYLELGFNKIGYIFALLGAIYAIGEIFKDEFAALIGRGLARLTGNSEYASEAAPLPAWTLFGILVLSGALVWFIVRFYYRRRRR